MIALKTTCEKIPESCKECVLKMRVNLYVRHSFANGYESVASCIHGFEVGQNIFDETRHENCPFVEVVSIEDYESLKRDNAFLKAQVYDYKKLHTENFREKELQELENDAKH